MGSSEITLRVALKIGKNFIRGSQVKFPKRVVFIPKFTAVPRLNDCTSPNIQKCCYRTPNV